MTASSDPKPFLKWVGGKRQLLAQLRPFFPASIDTYREPFLGSGAVFFDLCARGVVRPESARLSDDNADLIGTYLRVRDATEQVIEALMCLAEGHQRRGPDHYYMVRDERFNPGRAEWVAGGGDPHDYPTSLAAMLLYLNRTGYNGLFRLNGAGGFNVPAGRYTNPRICDATRLRRAAELLAKASIAHASFENALRLVQPGDVVYLDPPYGALSRTANFRAYTAGGFDASDQERLRAEVVRLAALGAHVVLSNSTAPDILTLYARSDAHRAGLHAYRVTARRAINVRADRRGAIEELVVTNAKLPSPGTLP